MSGVDYTSPAVHKSDLLRIEKYAESLGGGGGGGAVPDPLSLNQVIANQLTVNASLTANVPSATSSQILYINGSNQVTKGAIPAASVPDPLSVNQINANGGNITTLLGTTISATSAVSAPSLSGGTLTLNGLSTATQTQLLYIHPSTNVVTKGAVPTAAVPDPLAVNQLDANFVFVSNEIQGGGGGTLVVGSDIDMNGGTNINGVLTLTTIPNTTNSNVLYYDSTTKAVSYGATPVGGTRSVLFFNRKTALLLNGTVNTSNPINFTTGTAPAEWEVLKSVDFTVASNTITYTGALTKDFYVQTSYAVASGTSAANIAFQLTKGATPLSQARFNFGASLNFDCQDYNYVSLSTGDTLTLQYSSATTLASLASTNQSGLGSSSTKPLQIYITEI